MKMVPKLSLSRVWMNVSTSVNWNRPPVGIVRVEQELFKALSLTLGNRLRPCILEDGKFIPYAGGLGLTGPSLTDPAQQPFVWPDPSYEFPHLVSLDPMKIQRSCMPQQERNPCAPVEEGIGFGDVLISVGLDWDWEGKRLDSIMYDLKTNYNVKIITCCYDLIPVLFPQYCVGDVAAKFREYFTNQTWSSSGMLCISKCSETDYRTLARELGMPRIPTKVMLLGNKLPELGEDISDEIGVLCKARYVLFVSTIERRKNHEILYKALHILAERRQMDPDFKLVFLGMPGWGVADLLKDIELDPLVKEHIVQLNHANDSELRQLYECCEFFVYPSLYEGWGLPVAEALALGKFVIASNRGSIPEVGGELVEYVDPWNASAWADVLLKYWSNPDLVRVRAEKIRLNYHSIDWDETASAVLELIETVRSELSKEIHLEPGYDMQTEDGLPYGPRIVMAAIGGKLCHGPYRPLPKGPVRVAVELEKLGDDPIDLHFEFATENGQKVHKSTKRQFAGKNNSTRLLFHLDLKENVDDFEIVVRCPGSANISIVSASIYYG